MTDALSRRQEEDYALMDMTIAQATWLQEVAHIYEEDPIAFQLFGELTVDSTGLIDYTLHQGIIRFQRKIYMEKGSNLKHKILEMIDTPKL